MAGKATEFRVAMRPGASAGPDPTHQKTRLRGLALPRPKAERGGATGTAARSTCWQRCRTCTRPDGNCSQQPDQGIGMAERRDSASRTSPNWMNTRPEVIKKWSQKQCTVQGTLPCSLPPLEPRLSRESLTGGNRAQRNFRQVQRLIMSLLYFIQSTTIDIGLYGSLTLSS